MKMTKKEKGNLLEHYIASLLKEVFSDNSIRPTRGSGNATEIGDVSNSKFFIEAKNWNKENITMKYSTWLHLINQLPINTNKVPLYVFRNNKDKNFVIMEFEDFIRILKERN
jgi:hypothetical protein